MAALLWLLRYSRASGAVVEARMSFERLCPCHWTSALQQADGCRQRRRTVFGLEALVRRPHVEQGAVHGEVAAGMSRRSLARATTAAKSSSPPHVPADDTGSWMNMVASKAASSMHMSRTR